MTCHPHPHPHPTIYFPFRPSIPPPLEPASEEEPGPGGRGHPIPGPSLLLGGCAQLAPLGGSAEGGCRCGEGLGLGWGAGRKSLSGTYSPTHLSPQ